MHGSGALADCGPASIERGAETSSSLVGIHPPLKLNAGFSGVCGGNFTRNSSHRSAAMLSFQPQTPTNCFCSSASDTETAPAFQEAKQRWHIGIGPDPTSVRREREREKKKAQFPFLGCCPSIATESRAHREPPARDGPTLECRLKPSQRSVLHSTPQPPLWVFSRIQHSKTERCFSRRLLACRVIPRQHRTCVDQWMKIKISNTVRHRCIRSCRLQ